MYLQFALDCTILSLYHIYVELDEGVYDDDNEMDR